MRATIVILALIVCCWAQDEEHIERLWKLEKLKNIGILNEEEYAMRKKSLVDEYLGVTAAPKFNNYRRVYKNTDSANWSMPKVFTPQTNWLLKVFNDNMPRSYDDVLPYNGGTLYWKTATYLTAGAFDFNGTKLPLDDQVAIQERALTHVGLNLYDGGVWAVSLALSGFSDIVDVYHRNTLYTSGTGANPQVGGLRSIRAWEPNPDPQHPPDLFYYGRDKVSNLDIKKVTMPANLSYVRFKDGCTCPTSGCCTQEGTKQIPGNYFYRMIGPGYLMTDPLQGAYAWTWRAEPVGTNPDPAQYWNAAGTVHWNDWKPITGENVWGAILGPMQVLFLKNCTHIPTFATFDAAPHEVQLAVSILPAVEALISPLGSLYHCPRGTKMYPPDDLEETNVSNENNFSAYASLKALYFVLLNFYKGSDPALDDAVRITKLALDNLEHWFAANLLPAPIAGEHVISQGGHVTFDGNYDYQKGDQAFAVDCQTWGLLVYGSKKFDANYGSVTNAYSVWQATKKLAGFYVNGKLAGVGYTTPKVNSTDVHSIWSGEWTWGAVFMTYKLALEYKDAGKFDWAESLMADSQSMVEAMANQVVPGDDGVWTSGGLIQSDGSYLYANKRFFIPWGWYANPIGATSSTGWAVFNYYQYNPFQLGGGSNTTWFTQQCADNTPDSTLLDKLKEFYAM